MRKIVLVFSLLVLANTAFAADMRNDNAMNRKPDEIFNTSNTFAGEDGETLYRQSCRSCHMENGEGAHDGAGMYPALANNPGVTFPQYTAGIVMHGLRGMPAFSSNMSDEQVAAVANFSSVSFGNNGTEKVTVSDVKSMRPSL